MAKILNEKGELVLDTEKDIAAPFEKMTATLEDIKNGYTGLMGKVDGIPTKEYIENLVKPKEPDKAEAAKLEDQGIFSDVMSFEFMNIPVGKAFVGGAIAILATEVIDGFFAAQSVTTRGVIKLAGAAGTMMFLRKPLGNVGSGAVALLLTFDALRDLTPLDTWMANLATKITGMAPTAGLADKSARRSPAAQPPHTIQDYYAAAEGRR